MQQISNIANKYQHIQQKNNEIKMNIGIMYALLMNMSFDASEKQKKNGQIICLMELCDWFFFQDGCHLL